MYNFFALYQEKKEEEEEEIELMERYEDISSIKNIIHEIKEEQARIEEKARIENERIEFLRKYPYERYINKYDCQYCLNKKCVQYSEINNKITTICTICDQHLNPVWEIELFILFIRVSLSPDEVI